MGYGRIKIDRSDIFDNDYPPVAAGVEYESDPDYVPLMQLSIPLFFLKTVILSILKGLDLDSLDL